MQIQSIIFFKSVWKKDEAIAWLKAHNKKHDIDEKEHAYRARQKEPTLFDHHSFRIKEINAGMDFVIGKLK